ncbi:hypothetical protein [Candidatus Nitrospira bockiana]
MPFDHALAAHLKSRLRAVKQAEPRAWQRSRKLVGQDAIEATRAALRAAVASSDLPAGLKEALSQTLGGADSDTSRGDALKELTGLPPTKALRALCVLFGIGSESSHGEPPGLTPVQVEQFVRERPNPYDLLLAAPTSSLLDLGSGDLSFAVELVDRYSGELQSGGRHLTLHCLDRLDPRSRLGGRLHADPRHLERLHRASRSPSSALTFRLWGNVDMLELDGVQGLLSSYTIVTCHAPATPTFAYEPTRVAARLIEEDLKRTKGDFRRVRVDGEEALEVLHGGRALLFPPWKFDVKGPLALLCVMARRGRLCVLTSIDSHVFWELLSQLLEGERVRPKDVIFTPAIRREVFGPVYEELNALPIGGRLVLNDVAPLRSVLPVPGASEPAIGFRYAEVRRGAVFEGLPASQTARLFGSMREEEPPWFLTLVPASLDRYIDGPRALC